MFQTWLTNIAYFSNLIFGLLSQLWVNCVIKLYLVCWFQNKLELAGTVRLPEMHVSFLQQWEKPQLYSVVSIKCHRTSTVIFYRGGIWGLPNFSEGRTFSLMRLPKVTFKCTSRGKPHEGLSLIKLGVIENACFSKLNWQLKVGNRVLIQSKSEPLLLPQANPQHFFAFVLKL